MGELLGLDELGGALEMLEGRPGLASGVEGEGELDPQVGSLGRQLDRLGEGSERLAPFPERPR